MKRPLLLIIATLFLSFASQAQTTDAFDIATFQVPKGWSKEANQNTFQITTVDDAADTYCVITVYRSVPGPGNSKENFDTAWKSIAKRAVTIAAAPVMQPSNNPEDWKAEMGSAPFEKDGVKGVAVLVTLSGYGKMINVLILTNSSTYERAITDFLESASIKKPEAPTNEVAAGPAQTPSSAGQPHLSVTSYNWKQSQSRKDATGSYAGYSANTYQFLANNTYKFSQVTFQNYAPKYYLEDESGTYTIAGNTITIMPKKGTYRTYRSTREDPVLKSGDLEPKTARYSFEIVNLNNNWTLLLSPVDGLETKRDGQFSFWLNGEKRKTYSYNSVNAQGELMRP